MKASRSREFWLTWFVSCIVSVAASQVPHVEIDLTPADRNLDTFIANGLQRTHADPHGYEITILLGLANTAAADGMNAHDIEIQLNKLRSAFDNDQTIADSAKNFHVDEDYVEGLKTAAHLLEMNPEIKEIPGIDTILDESVKWGVRAYERSEGPEEQVSAQATVAARFESAQHFEVNTLLQSYLAITQDPNGVMAQVYSDYFQPFLKASPGEPFDQILHDNTSLAQQRVFDTLRQSLQNNEIHVSDDSLQDLSDDFEKDMGKVRLLSNEDIVQMRSWGKQYPDQFQYRQHLQTNSVERKQIEKDAATERQRQQLAIAGLQASCYLISRLIATRDPTTARRFSVVANSSFQIVSSISAFEENSKISATYGSIILAMNILGAIDGLSALMSDHQDPNEVIREEVVQLSHQIASLQSEMRDRFDRVDLMLNQIYKGMLEDFASIQNSLNGISNEISAIERAIRLQAEMLNRFETNISETFRDLLAATYDIDTENCLAFKRDFIGVEMPASDFIKCLSELSTYATQVSTASITSGTLNVTLEDADIQASLNRPVEANLRSLTRYARLYGFDPFPDYQDRLLANPSMWSLAANDYLTVAKDWPKQYEAARLDPLNNMIATGQLLQTFFNQMRSGFFSSSNRHEVTPISNLLADYRRSLKGFQNFVDADQQAFENDHLKGYKLAPGYKQKAHHEIENLSLTLNPRYSDDSLDGKAFRGFSATVDVPSNQIPDEFLIAEDLGLGTIRFFLDSWKYQPYEQLTIGTTAWFIPRGISSDPSGTRPGEAKNACLIFFSTQTALYVTKAPSPSPPGPFNDFPVPDTTFVQPIKDHMDVLGRLHGTPDQNGLTCIRQQLTEAFKAARRSLNRQIFDQLGHASSSEIDSIATKMSVRAQLIRIYLALGFPTSLQRDDVLIATLYGKQGIFDDDTIRSAYFINHEDILNLLPEMLRREKRLETALNVARTQAQVDSDFTFIDHTVKNLTAFRDEMSKRRLKRQRHDVN